MWNAWARTGMGTGWLEIPEEKEYLEDPRRRWETNNKVYSN
jgi:hypothetical protein